MGKKNKLKGNLLIFLEVALFTALFFLIQSGAIAGVGTPNVTVITNLTVGNVYPEVLNVSIDDDAATVTLTANTTTNVRCLAVIRDFNGEADINQTNATFYDSAFASNSPDDNNNHYTNSSCIITNSFGSYNGYSDDAYTSLANCTFQVLYYANAREWTCSVFVNDSKGWEASGNDTINISQLLALELPDFINYGTVNATEVSDQRTANVSNAGNTDVNLSLEGYARSQGDGYAMNCTLGALENISVEHEKYNLTTSNLSTITLDESLTTYANLSTTPAIRTFNLTQRQNDTFNEAVKPTYWRIYVPIGVAGTCAGNIIFGATIANGT